jgi:hypothetical protein
MATAGTTPGAVRFTTEAITIEEEGRVALLPSCVAEGLAPAALLFTTAQAEPPSPSTEIPGLLEDMLNPAVRAASAPVPSAATIMADRKGAFRHAEAPAWVETEGPMGAVEEGFTAVEAEGLMAAVVVAADIGNRQFCYVSGRSWNLEMERSHMERTKLNFDRFHCANLPMVAAVAILLTGCCSTRPSPMAQQPGQKTFSSAEEAVNALVTAAQSNDEKAMLDILGPDGRQIVSSGDETEDVESRANFVQRYQEMHRLVVEPDGTTTLYIGAKNWPTPIPLVNEGNSWHFDTEAGKTEILYRRIGRNEISTIRVCRELVEAEKEYYSTQHNEYAQTIFSDEGQHNGLYWKAADGEPQSPIGPLVASAFEGYAKSGDGAPTPYRGYYYQMLTRQGENGPGGAKNYIVNGKMAEGFAFVAYPAEYKSSGVMTFIVNEDGVVYQKDLGKTTDVLAKAMKEYNPDSSWQKAEEQPEEPAGEQKTK